MGSYAHVESIRLQVELPVILGAAGEMYDILSPCREHSYSGRVTSRAWCRYRLYIRVEIIVLLFL